MINKIKNDFGLLKIQESLTYKNMTLFPITGKNLNKSDYLCFHEELITTGAITINEIDDGTVASLRVKNNCSKPIFMPDGMIFKGGFQTRTNDYSLIIDSLSTVDITTSCVEQGRWSSGQTSSKFNLSSSMMYGKGRANKTNSLQRSLQEDGFAKASQNEVWASVSSKFHNMNKNSNTYSLNDMNNIFENKTNKFIKAFQIENHDRGLIYACNDQIIGLDLFNDNFTLNSFFDKLVKGIALDCIEEASNNRIPSLIQAQDFFGKIINSTISHFDTIGSGEHYEMNDNYLDGILFFYNNSFIHCAAFNKIQKNYSNTYRKHSYKRN